MTGYAAAGSKRLLQIAVNRQPELLLKALRRGGAIGGREWVTWSSPLEDEGFREYRDGEALKKARIDRLTQALSSFWPHRGPVWDAVGVTSGRKSLFVEARTNMSELVSQAARDAPVSRTLIDQSLVQARKFYSPRSTAEWSDLFYQYANRLAHQYFLRELNGVPSNLVFLYFVNAEDELGSISEEEWRGAIRLIHEILGLPNDLTMHGIFNAFLDAQLIEDAA